MNKVGLRPTLWRTARALANENRLRLVREVWRAKGSLSVTELARRLGLAIPTASQYLRALNARGLLSVGRNGSFVYYSDGRDRSLPEAQVIQDALSELFARKKLHDGWELRLVAVLHAYSHFRRIDIVKCLAKGGGMGFHDILRTTRIPKASLVRHLCVLKEGGVVSIGTDSVYALSEPRDPLAVALCSLVLESAGVSVPHFAKTGTVVS